MRSQALWNDLRRFWFELFPKAWPILEQLITCNGRYHLSQCEISPRWEREGGKTVMSRSRTFKTGKEVIAFCQEKFPDTLQVGAVVPSFQIEEHKDRMGESNMKRNRDMCTTVATGYGPIVLDFDLNDFDRKGMCPCLDEKKVCNKCFKILGRAVRETVHYLMEEVFGMTDIFDVYSGKRGIHIWICCDRAVEMTKDERTTFIERISKPLLNEGITDDVYRQVLLPLAKEYPDIFQKLDKKSVIERLYPQFDCGVTADPCHLKKLPLMPHQDTRNIAILLDNKFDFEPETHPLKMGQVSPGTYALFCKPLESFVKRKEKKRIKLDE